MYINIYIYIYICIMTVFVLECEYKPKYVFVYVRYVIFDSYVQIVPCEVKLCNDEVPPNHGILYS